MPSNCIYQNVEYRFRVNNGPMPGYLRVLGDNLIIVRDFNAASGLNLYKEEGWGLRVAHLQNGERMVLATNGGGKPMTLEEFRANDARQWFDIMEPTYSVRREPNQCMPGTSVKEYHPFLLESVRLRSPVSKKVNKDLVVGGVNDNKNFDQLELCIVSTTFGCDKFIPSNCIYQNVEYRFRVNSPVKGYLKVQDDAIEIVEDFNDASGLNLYREEGWGLRVAHIDDDGIRKVFSTNGAGNPITLVEQIKDDDKQWFEILESNNRRTEQDGCVPDTAATENQLFKLRSVDLNSYLAKRFFSKLVVSSSKIPRMELELCLALREEPCRVQSSPNCIYQGMPYRLRVESPIVGYLTVKNNRVEIVEKFYDADGFILSTDGGLKVEHIERDGSLRAFTINGPELRVALEEPETAAIKQSFTIDLLQ
ncbi:hypothetical protein BGZ65_006504 [Modicella reniformis]|uniref:Uncharacterized protein n=1 Tax=Modicella reniformis TaxID=1440133 RepID=A0A9P6IWK6_9FUNG|nr:hypothetical protein BGZ65_006504 [Modicella reniformis]